MEPLQEYAMHQYTSTHEARATSAGKTPDDTSKAPYPALDPIHALMHLPALFHVPGATTGSPQEQTNKWVVLFLVALGGFMTTLDSSIVNIALPAIAHTFGVGVSGAIEWIIIGYLIVIAACLLTLGRLADMVGRKPIYEAGLVIFVFGSIFSGIAPSLAILILARLVQGVGGACIFAVNTAMITSVFPAGERGRALGLNAVVVALGVSAGPTIGGLITQYLTWRWIFYVNVPIGALVFIIGMRMLTEPLQSYKERFDPVGAVLFAIGLASMTLGFSFGEEWGWTSPGIISALVVGVVALVTAVLVERRVPDPILKCSLLKNRVFASANMSFMFAMLALFAPGFLLPFYFEDLRGFPAEQAGFLLMPLPLTLAVMAPLSGSLADRFGSRILAPLGLAIACFGLVLLSQLNAHSSIFDIIWRLVVIGIGQGLFQSPNTRALMGAAPTDEQGIASGLLSTGRVIGQALSVALAGTIFSGFGAAAAGVLLSSEGQRLSTSRVNDLQNTFLAGFHAAFLVCAACAAIGIITSLVRSNENKNRQTPPET
jgi:EmrB/QacA subfamily drug resistance transporter